MRKFIFKSFLFSLLIMSMIIISRIRFDKNFKIVDLDKVGIKNAETNTIEMASSNVEEKTKPVSKVVEEKNSGIKISSRSLSVRTEIQEPKMFEYESYELLNGNCLKFGLYTPEVITENMPVIVYMHGSGECGASFEKYKNNVALYRNLANKTIGVNAIIIFPIAPNGIFRTESAAKLKNEYRANVLSLLEEMSSGNFTDQDGKKIITDKNKNALMGFSMGAGIALGYSKEDVQKFNTFVFMSAFDVYSAKNYTEANSIMTIVGTEDQPGAKEGTVDINKIFENAGTNYITKEYKASHSTIQSTVFSDNNLLEWILNQM